MAPSFLASSPMISEWLYFGCYRQAGHFLFLPGMRSAPYAIGQIFGHFDGVLCPRPEMAVGPYRAALSRFGGLGYSALSFWDYTVDKRGQSNSNFFVPDLFISAVDLLRDAKTIFPHVWSRLPDVQLLHSETDLVRM
jgi:hypothetical protein